MRATTEDLHYFEHTVYRGQRRVAVSRHVVYRGNPGCPKTVAECTTKEAADAALRLLRIEE